jgi:hypothetical protein
LAGSFKKKKHVKNIPHVLLKTEILKLLCLLDLIIRFAVLVVVVIYVTRRKSKGSSKAKAENHAPFFHWSKPLIDLKKLLHFAQRTKLFLRSCHS